MVGSNHARNREAGDRWCEDAWREVDTQMTRGGVESEGCLRSRDGQLCWNITDIAGLWQLVGTQS